MKKKLKNSHKGAVRLWLILLLASALMACGEPKLQVAAGDHAVLEQLATSFRKVGEMYPVQPHAMPVEGRRKFVVQVFTQAGYSYSASLLALSKSATDSTKQDQRDLAELLLVPTKGLPDKVLAKVYSEEELAAVRQLKNIFR